MLKDVFLKQKGSMTNARGGQGAVEILDQGVLYPTTGDVPLSGATEDDTGQRQA